MCCEIIPPDFTCTPCGVRRTTVLIEQEIVKDVFILVEKENYHLYTSPLKPCI